MQKEALIIVCCTRMDLCLALLPDARVFDFVNFDLFAVFAIFIWIGVSVAQWYFGFNRLQLVCFL